MSHFLSDANPEIGFELIVSDNDTVVTTLDKIYELALCVCHNELTEGETIEYVSSFMSEYIECPR